MSIIPHKQLTLTDIYDDCQEVFENDKPAFLTLLANHINLDKIVPFTFNNHFYASTGRPRKYSLYSMLWALIIQRIFSIDTDSLLILFLDTQENCVNSVVSIKSLMHQKSLASSRILNKTCLMYLKTS
jgi:hypothetical protein